VPFFSIIIPTYNRAHVIMRPIDSVLRQTFEDWELIIVDDGSTDDTKSIIESYHDNRIRYVWQENQERSAARNHGIALAKGEWICFQDSDDEYMLDHLQVLFDAINLNKSYSVFRTGMHIYSNGQVTKIQKFNVTNHYELFPFDAFTTFAFKKEILNNIWFKKELINSQDLHFMIRVVKEHDIKIVKQHTNIYHYNPMNGAGLGKDYLRVYTSKILCFEELLDQKLQIKDRYLKRKLCLAHMVMLWGHLIYNKAMFFPETYNTIKCYLEHPWEFNSLLLRIFYVKFSEVILKKTFDYRF
jgi:glycosyltransferase involved in cell wall biosynthesis